VNAGIERIREHLIANGIPAKDFTEERVAAAAVTMARGVRADLVQVDLTPDEAKALFFHAPQEPASAAVESARQKLNAAIGER
jgi:hypothetical protein